MPFDRLPSYDLHIPEFHPYIAPARPVFPTSEVVEKAMAHIMDALDPEKRIAGKLAEAKFPLELQQIKAQQDWMRAHPGQVFMGPMQQLDYDLKKSRIRANDSLIDQRNKPKSSTSIPNPPHAYVPPPASSNVNQSDVDQAAQTMQQEQQLPSPDLPQQGAIDPNAPQIIPTS